MTSSAAPRAAGLRYPAPMSRRSRVRGLCGAALALVACACRERPPEPPRRVVVVVIDTLRADHLPAYGYAKDTAPFLTRLAREGVVFERAYAPASWTAPSTASLFTSLYPFQHGVVLGLRATRKLQARDEGLRLRTLPEALETLPEALQQAGYATFGLTQNVNISAQMGFDQGFQRFRNLPADDTADVLHARLLAWKPRLDAAGRSFLYLHYLDPHSPYRERAPLFDPASRGRARQVSAYDSEIRYVDDYLRRAYDAFAWDDDTLLVVTADHGEEFWEHGSVEHGRSLYGEVLNVPLLMRFPGGRWGGRRVSAPVSLIDVLPTLRAAVGRPRGAHDQGRDLLPLVRGERAPDERALFAHLHRPEPSAGRVLDQRAVLRAGRKLVLGAGGGTALFDLVADPLDRNNLAVREPHTTAALREVYAAFERGAPRHFGAERALALDGATRERLKALGYVE
jgi:arylsulfatase A-like enzyme